MGKCVECSQDVAGGGRLTSKLLKPKLQKKPSQTEEAASFVDSRLIRRALCTGLGNAATPSSWPGCGCLAGRLPLGDGLCVYSPWRACVMNFVESYNLLCNHQEVVLDRVVGLAPGLMNQ